MKSQAIDWKKLFGKQVLKKKDLYLDYIKETIIYPECNKEKTPITQKYEVKQANKNRQTFENTLYWGVYTNDQVHENVLSILNIKKMQIQATIWFHYISRF